jgi:hypothetical protein
MDLTNIAAVVPVQGEQTSSVELSTNAKGATQVSVKVCAHDPAAAAEQAQALDDALRAKYAPTPAPEARP